MHAISIYKSVSTVAASAVSSVLSASPFSALVTDIGAFVCGEIEAGSVVADLAVARIGVVLVAVGILIDTSSSRARGGGFFFTVIARARAGGGGFSRVVNNALSVGVNDIARPAAGAVFSSFSKADMAVAVRVGFFAHFGGGVPAGAVAAGRALASSLIPGGAVVVIIRASAS